MMESKERVATAKASYRSYQSELKNKTVASSNNDKKTKMQSKLFKLHCGKIQKISQGNSKGDSSTGMREIRKNLMQVTHLFDDSIDLNVTFTPPVQVKEHKPSMIRRMSGIKPE